MPHSTVSLRRLNRVLTEGRRLGLRRGKDGICVKQFPSGHRRTDMVGVLIIAAPCDSGMNEIARKIDRDKLAYRHSQWFRPRQLRFVRGIQNSVDRDFIAVNPSRHDIGGRRPEFLISILRRWGIGGSTHVVDGSACQMPESPVSTPIMVAISIISGIAPSVTADLLFGVGKYPGWQGRIRSVKIGGAWISDWRLYVGIILFSISHMGSPKS